MNDKMNAAIEGEVYTPINVVVSDYPTLAIYYDDMEYRNARGFIPKSRLNDASTLRELDAAAWRIRWATQKAGKYETLIGIYNFPTHNLMLTGALDLYCLPHTVEPMAFPVSSLVLAKLEELHQEFLTHPERVVRLQTSNPTITVSRPDFDLTLYA